MPTSADTFIEFEKSLSQINENNFDEIAWKTFHFQAASNDIYARYLKYLRIDPLNLQSLNQIPFLPIRFFKDYEIKSGIWPTQHIYKSSGTTQAVKSSHHLWDENFYLNHAASSFENFLGPLENFHVLALLPYYDSGHSSLVAMARHFIARSGSSHSGFFLNDHDKLIELISNLTQSDKKILLLGVSHALLELAERGPFTFKDVIVMETGGMKGRKEELTREELHAKIKFGFGVEVVYSEYGMTELCSQAYAPFGGIFQCAPSIRVIVKEISDPFQASRSTGIINIIDLANFHSCSFIETQDLGRVTEKGFEVLGRADNSEVRGCNLLLA
jgi:hypothetical protein